MFPFPFRSRNLQYLQDNRYLDWDIGNTTSYPGSGTVITSLAAGGRDGILTNGPVYDALGGGSIKLDGSNDTIYGDPVDLRMDFSIELWLNKNETNFQILTLGLTNATSQSLHLIFVDDNNIRFGMYSNDTDFVIPTVTAGVWSHMVFTYSHSTPYTKQLFLNSAPITGVINGAAAFLGTGSLIMGYNKNDGTNRYGDGWFSQVRIYDKILTAAEVANNFQATRGRYGV